MRQYRMAVRPNQRIIMLNNGVSGKGFTICCDCGAAMPGDDPAVLKDVLRPYRSKFIKTRCKHRDTINVNLGYDFVTDMLVLEFALDRQQIDINPTRILGLTVLDSLLRKVCVWQHARNWTLNSQNL